MDTCKTVCITIFLFLFALPYKSFSQTVIAGSISDRTTTLNSVNVILKDSLSGNIIAYTYADNEGCYELVTAQRRKSILEFSALGFETKAIPLQLEKGKKRIVMNVFLEKKSTELEEVTLHTQLPMILKEDTLSFKTKFYAQGNERTVEELLKTIPGVNIDAKGIIKVGNQEIEKLMVGDDDFFGKGYKILSKNMPAYPVKEIEILKHYANNKLLKGVEESNKVALNLKLDEKAKRIWFGNIEMAMGNDRFYEGKGNLMNFGEKNKYYFLTNLNDIGQDATGDIDDLIRPIHASEPSNIGDDQSLQSWLSLDPKQLHFKRSRINYNKAKLISLNAIFNPNAQLKIKPLVFLNWDKNDFFRNTIEAINTNGISFPNTEDYQLRNEKRIAFGKLDITYDIAENQMLETETKYNNGDFNDDADLVFNGEPTYENLRHKNTLFDQKIKYTNRVKDKKAFLLTGRYINEKKPQEYYLNQFFYQDLFPQHSSADNVSQANRAQMQFAGINAHLLDRHNNGDLLELQLGTEYRQDKLSNDFVLLEDEMVLERPEGYRNQTNYQVNDLYLKSNYRLKLNNFALTGKLNVHQLFNRLENPTASTYQNPFFVNPKVGFDWKINSKNKIMSSYAYTKTNAGILDVYSDFALTGFKSFRKGTGEFNQLNSSNFIFNYQLGNWSDRFFANTFVVYTKKHDYFSTNSLITPSFRKVEKILVKNQHFLSINSRLDYYVKSISTNLKLDLGYNQTDFKNIVNNSDLRKIKSKNYQYGMEVRSGFKGLFNFHFGTKWTASRMETSMPHAYTDNFSFLDMTFMVKEKLDIRMQTERYYFGNLKTENTYWFSDLDFRYKWMENKLTLGLTGKNLFNNKTFRNYSISDIGTSTTTYRLLPRYVLLRAEYRF